MKKLLVINADDLGYSVERDKGIIECYKSGVVTSASLMVNGESAQFASHAAKEAGFKIGLHFNITEGKPLSNESEVKSLLNHNGSFISKGELFQRASEKIVDLRKVRLELERQIERFEELMGYLPVHVDGHQHCHILPGIRELFAEVLSEKGIKVTRVPFEKLTPGHPWPDQMIRSFMGEVVNHAVAAREVYKQKGIWCSDGYFGLETMGSDFNSPMTADILIKGINSVFTQLEQAKPSKGYVSCELMTHPGYRTGEVGGCGEGPDSFSQSEDRETEMAVLSSKEFRRVYEEGDIQLVSFLECVQ
ncbi:hypothetical protein FSP39_000192 [Pinctada imbricata]|uniref:Carbohydrate deacetylase n=1 Tax=Pinctada imbricata TaxID=66713 RepID=A0AA88XIR5_PINIB|nr:hypothetical protein FSP39_000192 [Pinctada imbricata]